MGHTDTRYGRRSLHVFVLRRPAKLGEPEIIRLASSNTLANTHSRGRSRFFYGLTSSDKFRHLILFAEDVDDSFDANAMHNTI